MKMSRFTRLMLAGAVAVGLAACETVEFQTPPSMPLAQCDVAWVGDWRIADLRPDHEVVVGQEQFLRVTKDCERWLMVDIRPGEGQALEIEVNDIEKEQEVGFAKSEKHTLLALREVVDPDAKFAKAEKPSGYLLLDYSIADRKIELREADRHAAARLVVDDKTPGWMEKHDRNIDGSAGVYAKHFWVFLFGSADETKTLLDTHALFLTAAARLSPLSGTDSARLSAAIGEDKRRKQTEAQAEAKAKAKAKAE